MTNRRASGSNNQISTTFLHYTWDSDRFNRERNALDQKLPGDVIRIFVTVDNRPLEFKMFYA